jgi:hypothetical protein
VARRNIQNSQVLQKLHACSHRCSDGRFAEECCDLYMRRISNAKAL